MLNKKDGAGSISKVIRSAIDWFANSSGRSFVFIFILAFGIRACSWVKNPAFLPSPDRELGAIAWSLAETGHFADPYIIPTGPTAHLPPIPPAILALILSLFGNTWQAGYIFSCFTVMTSAAAYAMIPWIAGNLGMKKPAGLLAGLAGALIQELEMPDHGEGLAGITLALMLAAFLTRWSSGRSSLFSSMLLGLGIGASFHVQPALLLVFLGYFVFEICCYRGNRKFVMSSMLARCIGILSHGNPDVRAGQSGGLPGLLDLYSCNLQLLHYAS